MKELIVGNEDCSFNEIVNTISRNDHNVMLMAENWREFAMALETPGSEIAEIEQDLPLKKTSIMASVHRLLMTWRETKANKAKFTTLLDILEIECDWKDMAECLWKRFQKKMTENITWAELDERSRKKVMESQVMFQGQLKGIKELCSPFDEQKVEMLLQRALSGTIILQLLDSKLVSMTRVSLLDILPYYIPRSVSSRRKINPEIFKRECSDIFLIQDIDPSDLSAIARKNAIANSSHLTRSRRVEKVKFRFILLEFPQDFKKICKLCGSTAVHWLNFKNGNFYWIKTHGSLNLILEHVHHEQDVLSEDEFLEELLEEHKRRLPVIIADVPGMGKTCLLASLCRKRKASCDDKTLVLFISLLELLKGVGDLPQEMCKDLICKWVSEHVSQNAFGQEIVSKILQSDDHQVEIYFDAFDEVPSHQLSFTKCLLEFILDHLTHVHITITTRVHKRRELEETLNVVSHNLAPFLKDDQTQFFEKYWANCGISVNKNLKKLSTYLVNTVTSTLSSKECDVVGIPLQCFMLADIYQEDAAKYSNASSKTLETSVVNIQSVHEMYSALMAKRFSVCVEEEKNVLRKMHVLASIATVFPELSIELLEINQFSLGHATDVHLQKVNSMGILKAGREGNALSLQFLHHSYAEFLLADFLAGNLFLEEMEELLEPETVQMLFTKAFTVSEQDPNVHAMGYAGDAVVLWKEICQCPDGDKIRKEWKKLANHLKISPLLLANLPIALHVMKAEDFDLFYFVLYFWRDTNPKLSQLLNVLRSLAFTEAAETLEQFRVARIFQRSSLCFFIDSCPEASSSPNPLSRLYRLLSKVDLDNHPLYLFHVLQSCLYHDFECLFVAISNYYLQGHSDGEIVKEQNRVSKSMPWFLLIHFAVKHSSFNLVVECCNFVELVAKRSGVETEKVGTVRLESLYSAVHRGNFRIFDYLFKKIDLSISGIKLLLTSCYGENLNQSEHIIGEKLQIIKKIAEVSKEKDPNFRMPPLLQWRVHPDILQFSVCEGADLNSVEEKSGDTIAHGVATDYSAEQFHWFVEFLIEHKSIQMLTVCNKAKETPLHIALRHVNVKVETIELISSHLGSCFNHPNYQGERELFSAVFGLQKLPVLEAIVKCGGDPHRAGYGNQSILHQATVSGNVEAIRYFISLGCCVNARDNGGFTPLHCAFIWGERNLNEVVCVLLEHNANAKIRDRFGDQAISYAKEKDKLWMLKPDTLDRLAKMSEETIWDRAGRQLSLFKEKSAMVVGGTQARMKSLKR